MKESTFNTTFQKNMRNVGMNFYRIESHATCPGIPDNHFLFSRRGVTKTGWLEMKQVEDWPSKIDYRRGQAAWLEEYWMKGGISATVVRVRGMNLMLLIPGSKSLLMSRMVGTIADGNWIAYNLEREVVWENVAAGLWSLRETFL
jgi:hypothetical protein